MHSVAALLPAFLLPQFGPYCMKEVLCKEDMYIERICILNKFFVGKNSSIIHVTLTASRCTWSCHNLVQLLYPHSH